MRGNLIMLLEDISNLYLHKSLLYTNMASKLQVDNSFQEGICKHLQTRTNSLILHHCKYSLLCREDKLYSLLHQNWGYI